jgi:hypothetical protein
VYPRRVFEESSLVILDRQSVENIKNEAGKGEWGAWERQDKQKQINIDFLILLDNRCSLTNRC